MTTKETKERDHLHNLWMSGKASTKQMTRAMELDRKADAERKAGK